MKESAGGLFTSGSAARGLGLGGSAALLRAQTVAFLGPVLARARMLLDAANRARCFRDRQPIGNLSRCPWGGPWIHAAWTVNTVLHEEYGRSSPLRSRNGPRCDRHALEHAASCG